MRENEAYVNLAANRDGGALRRASCAPFPRASGLGAWFGEASGYLSFQAWQSR